MIHLTNKQDLVSYDGDAVFYSGIDQEGVRWVNYCARDLPNATVYLAVSVSEDRYSEFKEDRITVYELLTEPESGLVYEMTRRWDVDNPLKKANVESVPASDVVERYAELLPEQGIYLNLP